ncbi:MAG TPA: BlaI/MecI/CopY family transcriptional regulator [Terriglobales bacterium]|nr:BlaI/MecI/CopY family transcriptional regulator [Terriglobales bacterium]HKD92995.1 BlaI/MecI/CopY family transcriptional regulator [Terriglobales bacterium]
MPRKTSPTLTEAELRLMEILWDRGPSTVQQLVDALEGKAQLAYNSVLTTIRILEKKRYVEHVKDGRAHVYSPLVGRREASRFEVRHLLHRFFNNSHEALVLNLLEDDGLDEQEITRLRALISEGATK